MFNSAPLLLSLACFFWAGNIVAVRGIIGQIPMITLATMRWTVALAILLPYAWPYLKQDLPLIRRHFWQLLALSLIGPGLTNSITYIGLSSTDATNALIIQAAGPSFIALAAYAIYRDRLRLAQFAGLALGLVGVMIVICKADDHVLRSLRFNVGDLILLPALAFWSIYSVLLRNRPDISWQSFMVILCGVAILGNAPLIVVENTTSQPLVVSMQTVLIILYLGLFPSLLAMIFYNRGVELIGATRAGLYIFTVPMFGSVMAMMFLGEKLAPYHVASFGLISAGVLIGNRRLW